MAELSDIAGEGNTFTKRNIDNIPKGHEIIENFNSTCVSCKEDVKFHYITTHASTIPKNAFDIYQCDNCGQKIAEHRSYNHLDKD